VTEPDWLAATDPTPLIAYVRGRATGRQLAMAAIALCRSDRDLMRPGYSRDGVVWSERVMDGEIAPDDLGGLDPGADYLMGAAANRCGCVAGLAADGDLVRAHDNLAEVVEILIDQDWDNTRRLSPPHDPVHHDRVVASPWGSHYHLGLPPPTSGGHDEYPRDPADPRVESELARRLRER